MLDVKITAYIVPVAEQPQASLTPVIAVANIADEGAVITGLIRIYRESTGLMIYSSELAVTQLEHHSTTNIAALTPFDPPSPADDDYFIKADITATSYLPGPPTHDSLGAWYFDIKTPPMGEAPAGHGVTHELGGSDELDVTGLVGAGGVAVPAQVDVYTADDTWTKPAGAKAVYVEAIGPGGGGGGGVGGAAGTSRMPGAAAGGGVIARRWFPATALAATVPVTIGAGGAPGAGGAAGNGANGAVGTTTKFGNVQASGLWAFSGGNGIGGQDGVSSLSAGGAGTASAGGVLLGGYPGSNTKSAIGGQGAAGYVSNEWAGGNAEDGGGGGGSQHTALAQPGTGGSSLNGAAGAGVGGGVTVGDAHTAGDDGGIHGSYSSGGGATGGASGGAAGTAGADGDGYKTCGGGGGGGGGNNAGVGGDGGDGGAPGGGGAGGGGGTTTGGDGGTGARGEVRVYTFF